MEQDIPPSQEVPAAPQPGEESNRLSQPVDDEHPPRLPFPVVGVGASAGGIEAFGEFLDAMRPDGGMAFVFILHLPPEGESHLADVLSRRTAMPVLPVEDGMVIDSDHVYVIRPGHVVTIRDGRLRLGPVLGGPRAANRPVDEFFRSLAEEQRERAVCIILSGLGSNGTAGAQAIKAVGGLCLAQDPDTAQYPSMPRHLVEAGYADHILRPAEIPEVLLTYVTSSYAKGGRKEAAGSVLDRDGAHLREILAVLRTRTRQDFSGYKKPTLLRRIQRRMGLARLDSMADYTRILRQTPAEVTSLSDDLLIHVTGFFRDPEAWDALRRLVIVPLVANREPGGSIRAWAAACSSGEEAYSLAMLLVEEAERAGKSLDIKVFATDLADRTLAHARAGVYPGGIESEVSRERLERFFARESEMYRVRSDLRDRVVFAPQNILQDPPFSRLDIATCRNLLIYLEPDIQRRVLHLLHFGLREGGALFLGSSEMAGGAEGHFEVIDRRARLFRRVGPTRHGTMDFALAQPPPPALGRPSRQGSLAPPARPTVADGSAATVAELTRLALLKSHTPPAVTVDREGMIVYYHGEVGPFLRHSGEPTRELQMLAREGVRGAARLALHRAMVDGYPATIADGWIDQETGRRIRVAVTASPVTLPDAGEAPAGYFVVSFADRGELPPPISQSGDGDSWEAEIRRLRSELQGTIEELQTSNEELRASNEEVTSVNEELQSTNEEMETGKEEMQSLNEELATVNAQLRSKMEEHQAASSDLSSLLTSTDIAVLFLDTSFRIRRYTPAVRALIDLIPGDVGRPVAALARRFEDPHLDADSSAVLERLVPVEREVSGIDGRQYLRRVNPYRTTDNRIDGVVVTFVDITERKRAEDALRDRESWLRGQREALEAALGNVPLEESLGKLVRVAVQGIGEGARAAFYLANAEDTALRHVVGMPAEYAATVEGFRIGPESLACGLATATGKPVITVDVTSDPRWEPWRDMAARFDYRACWSFPIHTSSGKFVGTLAIYSQAPRDATPRDMEMASVLTHTAAIIISQRVEVQARQQAEAALRGSEERLRLALAAARMGTWRWEVDSDRHERDANLNRLLGRPPEPSAGPLSDFLACIHPDDRGRVADAFQESVRQGRNLALEFRVVRPDGTVRWLRDQGDAFGGPEGRYLAGACVDVTDLKEAERELRASEERLRAIAAHLPNAAVYVVESDFRYSMAEGHALRSAGLVPAGLEGRTVAEAMGPDLASQLEPNYRRALAGESFSIEHSAHGRHFATHMGPLPGPSGRMAALAVSYDITDRVLAEEEVRRARDELEARVADRTAKLREEISRRKDLTRRLATAQEDERRRVSRDLHDTIGQLSASLSLAFKAIETSGELPPPASARLADAQRIADSVGREVHGLAIRLRPTSLDDLGLVPALEHLVAEWSERAGIRVEFLTTGLGPSRLGPEIETTIYRVVQEALTNVAKHAGASAASVVMSRSDGDLLTVIEDDGVGFDPGTARAGRLGLVGMEERVTLVGGTLQVESAPGSGTTILARIPIGPGPEGGRHGA